MKRSRESLPNTLNLSRLGRIMRLLICSPASVTDPPTPPPNSLFVYTPWEVGFIATRRKFNSNQIKSKLAAAVITTYSLMSLLFVAFIINTGHTSISWDSAMELVVLALQSKEPDDLGHVSVGLDSMDTFRRTVGIRVNTVPVGDTGERRERLELVFEHDNDGEKRDLTKLVKNRAY